MRLKVSGKKNQKGFSLVELIVAVAIFLIITSIILVKHSEFSGTLLIENLAYDIALSVRKAQVFGLSVREFTAGSNEFNVGYGVHFDSASNNTYIFFADRNRNEKYDDSSEILEIFTLRKGNIVSEFCGTLSNGTEKCSPSDISFLDIVFERPNPDAIIKSNLSGDEYASSKITVTSPQGTQWNINIVLTGQISVQK
ncbi:MAG: prepilin-type N-terminal cleavage/methylation domain-containing protein [Candidatus Pacebacteria bacterium]|jgi:prepilin-type N-terminal cleavage/methylation domain-containing protein|nr:hypothetical protein [Parcubacteria group bacterium]MDP6249448.1 prepilin-type N-terminal cleavage/methylation domain-containing protein [Candidatus Paceibacterota bacterium]MDP7159570.1 prepilin-type N-terminal cleavage/methylation domain-containing protein [Candidatus Paceibacterota bacterium]MDP7366289.1 prepilin-type N-terminal cleavage/methylation domain-containing protein [Candidatus Paceibacterota bacterium]MDP7466178.1 prepilin-type N-terminal cleavage/methylation domain-containing p|tara:strand:+ start:105 stop:695 length:591 start_codon:yes stop_codon:yes gene_type:complete